MLLADAFPTSGRRGCDCRYQASVCWHGMLGRATTARLDPYPSCWLFREKARGGPIFSYRLRSPLAVMDVGGTVSLAVILGPGRVGVAGCRPPTQACLFFGYTVRIGRYCLLRRQMHRPTGLGSWLHAGLSHAFLAQYWASLWKLKIARRIILFFWLTAHAGLAVGTWGALMGHGPLCIRCDQQLPETQASGSSA